MTEQNKKQKSDYVRRSVSNCTVDYDYKFTFVPLMNWCPIRAANPQLLCPVAKNLPCYFGWCGPEKNKIPPECPMRKEPLVVIYSIVEKG